MFGSYFNTIWLVIKNNCSVCLDFLFPSILFFFLQITAYILWNRKPKVFNRLNRMKGRRSLMDANSSEFRIIECMRLLWLKIPSRRVSFKVYCVYYLFACVIFFPPIWIFGFFWFLLWLISFIFWSFSMHISHILKFIQRHLRQMTNDKKQTITKFPWFHKPYNLIEQEKYNIVILEK